MRSFLDEGPIRLVGRLGRVERVNNEDLVLKRANRVGFEFDAVDARAPLDGILQALAGEGEGGPLALLKVLTTLGRFGLMTVREQPQEGDWYLLELEPRRKRQGPLAWAVGLAVGGYGASRPFVLRDATWLFHEDEPPLRPLSAAVAGERALAQAIAAACDFPAAAIGRLADVRALLASQAPPHDAVVRDVGQASLASLRNAMATTVLHLDAGWPISWNYKTAPKTPPIVAAASAPVILSHWDWDHLHGFHRVPGLAACHWIAPAQKLGPGAKRVAASLAQHHRLYAVGTRKLVIGPFVIGRCKGEKGDSNNTGLAVRVTLASGKQLLFVGDADYACLSTALQGPADFLVVTHHGAKFDGAAAAVATRGAPGVVSVGAGNGYGHPASAALRKHRRAGWNLRFTSKWGSRKRGQRVLGP